MSQVRPLFISTYPPEECGLATFTRDTADAVDEAANEPISRVAAIQKRAKNSVNHDPRVEHVINNDDRQAYVNAARHANYGPYDVVSLQHEFGLYPEANGKRILEFFAECKKPVVTTLHTLMLNPDELSRYLVRKIATKSRNVVVMTEIAAKLLSDTYHISDRKVQIIPHGVPKALSKIDQRHKKHLGLAGKSVICTFGLINRGKGLESMIAALPEIVKTCPDVLYLIIGMTHPEVLRQEGEVYRESLQNLAEELGVSANVKFVNEFLELPSLLEYLQVCDIYITPYLGKDQISSGTLAYALSTVGAVISTPYLYAEEVLAEGRGLLVPFGDSRAMAESAITLFTDKVKLKEVRRRAFNYTRPMLWSNVGERYLDLFSQAIVTKSIVGKRIQPSISTMASALALPTDILAGEI
jgi:glycosyltransferase involved in cell wall biosynthesis